MPHSYREAYYTKVIKAGSVIEVFQYETPIFKGVITNENGRAGNKEVTDEEKELNRTKTLYRQKREVRNIINANIRPDSKFLTLTFADDMQDLTEAYRRLKAFLRKLAKKHGKTLKSLTVAELTKEKRIHFHLLMFDMPYTPQRMLSELWDKNKSRVWINRIDTKKKSLSNYMTKYMTKEQDEFFKGQKRYTTSRNLKKAETITDEENVSTAIETLSKDYELNYKNSYEQKKDGTTVYYSEYVKKHQ